MSLMKELGYVFSSTPTLHLIGFVLPQVPNIEKYSAGDHVLAGIMAEIKDEWSCKQKLHDNPCVDVRNSHVQIHQLRMREWAS